MWSYSTESKIPTFSLFLASLSYLPILYFLYLYSGVNLPVLGFPSLRVSTYNTNPQQFFKQCLLNDLCWRCDFYIEWVLVILSAFPFVWDKVSLFIPGWPHTHNVILLVLPPKDWYYKCRPPSLAMILSMFSSLSRNLFLFCGAEITELCGHRP